MPIPSGRYQPPHDHQSSLPLSKARKEARHILGEVAAGRDPLQKKRADLAARADNLQSVAEKYLKREGKICPRVALDMLHDGRQRVRVSVPMPKPRPDTRLAED